MIRRKCSLARRREYSYAHFGEKPKFRFAIPKPPKNGRRRDATSMPWVVLAGSFIAIVAGIEMAEAGLVFVVNAGLLLGLWLDTRKLTSEFPIPSGKASAERKAVKSEK